MEGKIALRCGLASVVTLVGWMVLGIGLGNVLFESLPGHMNEPSRIGMSAVPALAGFFSGGAL